MSFFSLTFVATMFLVASVPLCQLVCSYVLAFTLSRHLKVGHSIGTCGTTVAPPARGEMASPAGQGELGWGDSNCALLVQHRLLDCCSMHLSFLGFVLYVVLTPYNSVANFVKFGLDYNWSVVLERGWGGLGYWGLVNGMKIGEEKDGVIKDEPKVDTLLLSVNAMSATQFDMGNPF